MRVLHLTMDGVLKPIAWSQVVGPVAALAAMGHPQVIASLEYPEDLADEGRVREVQRALLAQGIGWAWAPYTTGGGPRNYARNAANLARLALATAQGPGFDVALARTFLAGPAARALRARRGVPWVYDIRGYWVDHRAHIDGWPAPALALARALEAGFYGEADGVVSLTDLGVEDVRSGRFGAVKRPDNVVCIPTTADYSRFTLHPGRPTPEIPAEVAQALDGRLVIGWVGSVNADYDVDAALDLFGRVLALRPGARLLALTHSVGPLTERLAARGLGDAAIVRKVHHDEVPAWLPWMDWGLLLLRSHSSKDASMPTKLGEFFAAGVRPVQHGCNAEVGHWVRLAGSGIAMKGLGPGDLEEAAQQIVSHPGDLASRVAGRDRTRAHFDLQAGARRYESVFNAALKARSF